jgi:hypothetical protein
MEITRPKAPVEAVEKRTAQCWMRGIGSRTSKVDADAKTATMITRARTEGWMITETARPKRVLEK